MTVAPLTLAEFHQMQKIDESTCCAKCLARFKEVVKEYRAVEASHKRRQP